MTQQKHRKALIRARMARTGEAYTAARRHIVTLERPPGLNPAGVFRAHDRHCMTAVFTADDRHLVSGGFGGQARIWTLDGELVGELRGHEASVNVVRISPDGTLAVTASSDRTVRSWELPSGRMRALLGRHRRQLLGLDVDAARGRAWSGGADGRIAAWDIASGAALGEVDVGAGVASIAVRASDGAVAVATVGEGVTVRDEAGSELARLASDAEVTTSVTWSADGAFLLASVPGRAVAWATDDWDEVRSIATGEGGMLPIAASPDGGRIAVGWDHHVGLWGPDEEVPAATVDGLPKGVYWLSFSHDGSRLAVAAADGRVRLFDVS